MQCKRCGREISPDEGYEYGGETLCEDCYLDSRYPVKGCDPWAVYSATRSREVLGLEGPEGLTEQQQAIYQSIRLKGKATAEQLSENFHISQSELQRQLAILRHCELIKGRKESGEVYLVPFS